MRYIIGIDIGTQGTKGVVLNENLEIVARLYIEHGVSEMVRPGWAEHHPEEVWWNGFKYVLRGLLEKIPSGVQKIMGIGCSALGGCVPLSADNIPLRAGILYNDTRNVKEVKEMTEKLGENEILRIGKNVLSAQYIGPTILWFKKNEPRKFQQTDKILNPSNYITYKLTGNFVLDYSQAVYFNPFYDYERMTWSKEVCDEFSIPCSLLPKLKRPVDIAGKITKKVAQEIGLVSGTPVIVSTVDGLAEALSTGVFFEEGVMGLIYGTASSMAISVKEIPITKELLIRSHPLVPKQNIVGGATATTGALTKWFRDNFAYVEKEIQRRIRINTYELLSKEASQTPPGSDGLLVLPYFSGERTPINDARARGIIMGLTTYHSRGHVYRALLEGTAYALNHHFDLLESYGIKFSEIIASGGGTKSNLWVQIVSDVTKREQILPILSTGAEIGTAYLVAISLGVITDVQELRRKIRKGARKVTVNTDIHRVYQDYYKIYRGLYDKTKEDMHALADISSIKF